MQIYEFQLHLRNIFPSTQFKNDLQKAEIFFLHTHREYAIEESCKNKCKVAKNTNKQNKAKKCTFSLFPCFWIAHEQISNHLVGIYKRRFFQCIHIQYTPQVYPCQDLTFEQHKINQVTRNEALHYLLVL